MVLQSKVDKLETSIRFFANRLDKLKQEERSVEPAIIPKEPEISPTSEIENVQISEPEIINEKPIENSAPKVVKKENFDIQSAFLGNIFNKVGALAIIIAVVIFIKLVSPFFVITPVMKLVLGFLLGLTIKLNNNVPVCI